jgi:hypothetical protein
MECGNKQCEFFDEDEDENCLVVSHPNLVACERFERLGIETHDCKININYSLSHCHVCGKDQRKAP